MPDRKELETRLRELQDAEMEAHNTWQRVMGARMEMERLVMQLAQPVDLKVIEKDETCLSSAIQSR